MPSYKNELTEQLIFKALQTRPETKNQPYVQIELFYDTLCQMTNQNGSSSGFKAYRKFDRQVFDQILQESELIMSGNLLVVKVQSFVINLMRAEIVLNERLKSIHKHIQNVGEQLNLARQKGRPANRFDPEFEEAQKLQKQLQEIKNQKHLIEEDLFNLRLTFIEEDELKRLTKKLHSSKSNPYFKPLQPESPQKRVAQKQNYKLSGPSYHSIGPDRNSPSKRLSSPKNIDVIFTIIFLLTSLLLIIQVTIAIFYRVSFLNLVVLGFLELIFLKQKYSKIQLKFFMVANAFSILLDIVLLVVNKKELWSNEQTILFQSDLHWRFLAFVLILANLIGKVLLLILLIIHNFRNLPQQITLNVLCFSFSLKEIQRPSNEDIIHLTFSQVFS